MDRVHWERDLSPYYGSVESKRKGFVHFFKKWKSYALHNSRFGGKDSKVLPESALCADGGRIYASAH